MAVESRFVVIRNGAEVQTFMDKKSADEYDKMLDMADNLTAMFDSAPVELGESLTEELSVFLAQNREEVLIALQAKKPKPAKKPVIVENSDIDSSATIAEEKSETGNLKTNVAEAEEVQTEAKEKVTAKKKAPAKTKVAKKVDKDAA